MKSVKKLRSGALLVEVERKAQSDNLLKTTIFHKIEVKCTPHSSLNSCRGVIRNPELSGVTEEEMVRDCKDQSVTGARRITINKNGERIPINTFILTFGTPLRPKTLKIGYLSCNVDVYIPNPLQCYNCYRFGHGENRCSAGGICHRCGDDEDSHMSGDQCTRDAKCRNCGENHTSTSRLCPYWLKEKEVLRIKHTENLSFPDARKVVESRNSLTNSSNSYASVIKSPNKTIECVDRQIQCSMVELPPLVKLAPKASKQSQSSQQSLPKSQRSRSKSSTRRNDWKNGSKGPGVVQSERKSRSPTVKPTKPKTPRKVHGAVGEPEREQKGSEDPIILHNRFGSLTDSDEDMDTTKGNISPVRWY